MNSPPQESDAAEQPSTSTSQNDAVEPQPKKGILKRPSIKSEKSDNKDTIFPLLGNYRQSPDKYPDKPNTRIPKLSVTWWEKNAVAVFGDTSDENNTDSDQNMMSDLGNGHSKNNIRQTAILDSEDDDSLPKKGEENAKCDEAHEDEIDDETIEEEEGEEEEEEEEEEEKKEKDEESNAQDDAMSVASSAASGGSSIVGRWWIGKDTRYVPHCVKRGCKHSGHDHASEYLTPTQRKAREIAELKKELQNALQERDEKEKHLQELRTRIDEIDQLRDSSTALTERRSSIQKEEQQQFEKEKKAIERRHAVRVNQLVHETMQAREENTKLAVRIKELEDRYLHEICDAETMTDAQQVMMESSYACLPLPSNDNSASTLVTVVSLGEMNAPKIAVSPTSPSMSTSQCQQAMYLSQDAMTTLQAYQNEAIVWRNKAAQLELIIRDQLIKGTKENVSDEVERLKLECQRLRALLSERDGVMIDSGIEAPPSPQREHMLTSEGVQATTGECILPACVERKRNLISENNAMIEQNEEMTLRIRELEDDVQALRRDLEAQEEEITRKNLKVEQSQRESESKAAETAAATLVITRLQNEKDNMSKAISYMEERMTAYQNIILDNGLVMQDEETHNWRRGFSNPKYITAQSKKTQTTLTSEALNKHMDEFDSVQQKLKSLHEEYSAKRSDFSDRFAEIEANLLTKTKLVETLSRQLDEVRKEQRQALQEHQNERDMYAKSLHDIGEIAEQVPILKNQIEHLQKEKSEFDVKLKMTQEEYENGLEDALSESLRKYQEQSSYWKDKCSQYDSTIAKLKNEITAFSREKEELRVKQKMDKADLEHRLASSIEHASQMHKELHKSRRDVEVEAKPRHTSKYVACRPNTKEKGTVIEKGDLFDEQEERLKLCLGELSTTQKQVATLQQKLLASIKDKKERSRRAKIVGVRTPAAEELEKAPIKKEFFDASKEEELLASKRENERLHEKIGEIEEEKTRLVKEERARIQQLVSEFDNVRKELDQEIRRYESEKKWLKSRIHNLEKANTELENFKESISSQTNLAIPTISINDAEKIDRVEKIRRTFSETDVHGEEEETEISRLKNEVLRLNSELSKVHNSITRTASAASEASRISVRSQLSPAFHTLVDDINMVKTDLEKILERIDDDAVQSLAASKPISKPSPSEDDNSRHSQLLDTVVREWDTQHSTLLAKDLARSRQERAYLKSQNERLHQELSQANNELELLRKEPINASTDPEYKKMTRSKSSFELGNSSKNKAECKSWQDKAGTLFREVHKMREDLSSAQKERRDLKVQLAMMRGELELTRIQLTEQQRRSPNSLLSHTLIVNRNGEEIVKEMSVPLNIRDEDLKLTSRRTPTGSQILVDKVEVHEETRVRRESEGPILIERVSCNVKASSPRRSQHKKIPIRKNRSESAHSAINAQSNEYVCPVTKNAPIPMPRKTIMIPSCSMSSSWHAECGQDKSCSDEDDYVAKPIRTVPLREKVKSLLQENKTLREKVETFSKTSEAKMPVQIMIPNRSSQIELLEAENKRLRKQLKKSETSAKELGLTFAEPLHSNLVLNTDSNISLLSEVEKLKILMTSSSGDESSEVASAILQEENQRLQRENASLRVQLMEQKDNNENSLSLQRSDLKRRVEQLEEQLIMSPSSSSLETKLTGKSVKTDDEIDQSEHSHRIALKTAQKEAKVLRERIEGVERQMKMEKDQLLNEHAKRVEALERGRRNVLQENTLMMQKLESMGVDIDMKKDLIQHLEEENKKASEHISRLEIENENLKRRQKEHENELTNKFDSKIDEMETRLQNMQIELEKANQISAEASNLNLKLQQENATFEDKIAWINKENETLRENIDDLKKQLDEKQQPVQMIIPRKSNLVERLEREIEELKLTNVELNNEIEKTKKDQSQKDFQSELHSVKLTLELSKRENEMYEKKLRESEEERADMYAVMFKKGQQAVEFAAKEERVVDQMTEDRITLKFLRDAFYYYLLNRGDEKDHLAAIMTMLNFSTEQKDEVSRKRKTPDRR